MRRVTFLLPLTSGSAVRESIETVLSRVVAENRNLRCGKPSGLRAVARNALLPSFCARMVRSQPPARTVSPFVERRERQCRGTDLAGVALRLTKATGAPELNVMRKYVVEDQLVTCTEHEAGKRRWRCECAAFQRRAKQPSGGFCAHVVLCDLRKDSATDTSMAPR